MLIKKQKLNSFTKHIQGFTFLEMMIALVINIILLVALISLFSSNIGHYNKTTNADTLNQQLESAMLLMSNDIRRAGYWSNAKNDVNTAQNNNPFMASGADITVSGSCILFTYDYNSDGSLPSITSSSDDERYGFRLNAGVLQVRPPGATFACNAAANSWENVTNSTLVTITDLNFTLNTTTVPVGATSDYTQIRSVDISITGQLVSDTSVTKTLTEHVRVRNDKYVP